MKFTARTRKGFSLVETVMAVGITATVVITILALVPVGMRSLQESTLQMADARIIQTIAGRYQMKDWDYVLTETKATDWEAVLESTAATEFFFDDNGTEIQSTDSQFAKYHAFTARAVVVPAHLLPGDTVVNANLRQVMIRITGNLLNPEAFTKPEYYRQHQTLIARIDR
jgi:uncharacterized protein (TIGR02598 family)